jgi:hypothetical protein
MKHKVRRPWIVYRRALGVLRVVARYETRENALRAMKRSDERMWLFGPVHADEISPDLARALGVRT